MSNPKAAIFIPTYNERENVEKICAEILALGLDMDLVFLDDNSPDGTGDVLDGLAKNHPRVQVIHREKKNGIGSAHQEGIAWATQRGYSTLVTMDCDFTHPPRFIPDFVAKARDFDVVVGSRYLRRDSLDDWDFLRLCLTRAGHWVSGTFLRMPYDATGAFRLYRLDKIDPRVFGLVQSRGYSFFFESLYLLHVNGLKIAEVGITLPARTKGHSKMRLSDATHSASFLLSLWLTTLLNRERLLVSSAGVAARGHSIGSAEWDRYWLKQKRTSGIVFELIAAAYRKLVIRRVLDSFIAKHFRPGSELLHAGCGGGQVDTGVVEKMRVTALDISQHALDLYARVNGGRAKLLLGSVFKIPLPDASVDGVYNLGVMEHFSEEDIQAALKEFRRVLRPGGKILLFWPPTFGLSVQVLDGAHFILNRVLKRDVELHPPEISRIRSRAHARAVIEKAGFTLAEYYFGPKDGFTQAVIVGVR